MKSSLEILVEHALKTLPDSISHRRDVLRAVSHIISVHHPQYKTVSAMLGSLDRHRSQEAWLASGKQEGGLR